MATLIIDQVGPITKRVNLDLKRFNVFIGPQSSGKSTIAKILSTCTWIEKEVCVSLSTEILPAGTTFKRMVEDYHRMHGYIDEQKSYIRYESRYMTIVYENGQLQINRHEDVEYNRIKVSYVPADRNVLIMKEIELRSMESTNFRSFLFDWLDTRDNFDINHRAHILDLGVEYYYDQSEQTSKDKIIHSNGVTYDIPLYDASSGLQSIVPLVVLSNYYNDQYYANYRKKISFQQEEKERKLADRIIAKYLVPNMPHADGESVRDVYAAARKASEGGNEIVSNILLNINRLYSKLVMPSSISYIVEEPEQNLFPQTQVDLLNMLIDNCNGEHSDSMTITTHSPYLLAAVNIMLMAGKLQVMQGGMDPVWKQKVAILPDEISVYMLEDGGVRSILNERTGLIDQNDLDSASEYNAQVFAELYRTFVKLLREKK